jgi:hypothetical protein
MYETDRQADRQTDTGSYITGTIFILGKYFAGELSPVCTLTKLSFLCCIILGLFLFFSYQVTLFHCFVREQRLVPELNSQGLSATFQKMLT